MDLESFRYLLTPGGRRLVSEAEELLLDDSAHLRALTVLRRRCPAPLAAAAIETVLLRRRAKSKFSRANEMFFVKEALEQASGEAVSSYRARRFASLDRLADMTCGIGGDLIHLAQLAPTLAVDSDPLRLEMAAENARVYGVEENIEFRLGEIEEMEIPHVEAVWFDPSRRVGGRRRVSLSDYSPPVERMLERWLPRIPAVGVKIAPAVPYGEIPAHCETEFISDRGELKEAVLWFGPLRTAGRRATLLPSETTLTDQLAQSSIVKDPGLFLYEPDPAVIRAHLIEHLAALIDAWKLEEETAYLSSNDLSPTPFAQAYAIHKVMPFNLKKLNETLKSMDAGRAVVKRRGSPVDPREIEKKLSLEGDREVTLILTRSRGRSIAILCHPTGQV